MILVRDKDQEIKIKAIERIFRGGILALLRSLKKWRDFN